MDYSSLLADPSLVSDDNERASRKLYDSVAGYESTIFTSNMESTRNAARLLFPDAKATGANDYITMENIIADPNGQRISSLLTMNVALKKCTLKQPRVDADGSTLSDLDTAAALPPDYVVESPDDVLATGDGSVDEVVRSQLRFGFDPATEILKNCSAMHTVIHSFLRSALQILYEKVKEWGSVQLEKPGQEMALCKVIEICDTICEAIKLAKDATSCNERVEQELLGKNGGSCGMCKRKGHGSSTIVAPFIKCVNDRYSISTQRASDRIVRAANSNGGVPEEFLVRGGRQVIRTTKRPFAVSASQSAITTDLAVRHVMAAAKAAKMKKCVRGVVDLLDQREGQEDRGSKNWTEEELSSPKSIPYDEQLSKIRAEMIISRPELIPPLSPEESQTQEDEAQAIIINTALAPLPEQVQESAPSSVQLEAAGIPPNVEWVTKRDVVNTKAIEKYAERGSGINTGKYRGFNNTL